MEMDVFLGTMLRSSSPCQSFLARNSNRFIFITIRRFRVVLYLISWIHGDFKWICVGLKQVILIWIDEAFYLVLRLILLISWIYGDLKCRIYCNQLCFCLKGLGSCGFEAAGVSRFDWVHHCYEGMYDCVRYTYRNELIWIIFWCYMRVLSSSSFLCSARHIGTRRTWNYFRSSQRFW